MTQHVAHRKSDEIHELRAEIERLLVRINDQNVDYKKLEDNNAKCLRTIGELRAEIERLITAIRITASEDTYDEMAIRRAVSFELAELIVDARRTLEASLATRIS